MFLNLNTEAAYLRRTTLALLILCGFNYPFNVFANELDDSINNEVNTSSQYERLHNSASNGSPSAQYQLGLLFEYGRGVEQNDASAAFWYEKSASQLFVDAEYRLAILYDNGWGVTPDKNKAVDLYKMAAEKGHELAQHDLAIMYFHGSDAPKNLLEAYKWLKIAVLSGNPLMDKHLKRVADEMSSDEIAVAEHLAQEWIEHSDF